MNIRKTLAVGLVGSLTLLAACGGDDDDTSTPATDPPAEEPAPDEPAEEPAPDEPAEEPAPDEPADEPATSDLPEVCDGQDGTGLKVGFANLGGGVPFTQQVEDGIVEVAEQCNLELVIADNNFDGQTAIDNARNFVTQEVDGVIEFQIDAGIEGAVCEELGDLPVIAIDIAHPSCAVFMGAANRLAGELGGEAIGAWIQENWDCQVDLIVTMEQFQAGDVNVDRINGLIGGLASTCPDNAYGDFENWAPEVGGDSIITRCDCVGNTDGAFPLVRDILTANPDAERIAVLSLNDDMGLAAVAAAEEAGRLDQIAIASQGADSTVHDSIRDVPQYVGSTAYFPENYGTYLVPAIIKMINGETVEDPILVEHVFIDASNIDEYYPS